MTVKKIFTLCCWLFFLHKVPAQNDSTSVFAQQKLVWAATGVGFSIGFTGLYQAWYKPYAREGFSFFDDSNEWLGMDKIGHFGTSWFLHSTLADLAANNHFSRKQANRYGAISATAFMSAIEVMDGFSSGWGFSWSDYAANIAGIAYSSLQFQHPQLHLPIVKYSWQSGDLYSIRPELLGNSIPSRMLKNYNEQTYWLSMPVDLLSEELPAWLCLSFGYGASGLLGGRDNVWLDESGTTIDYSHVKRRSMLKFSFDVDLGALPLRKKWQKNLIRWVRWIKIPAPCLIIEHGKSPNWQAIYW